MGDLFCGAGGSSTGARQAIERDLGRRMDLVCVNHWDRAIETHKRMHPEARHYCQDVASARPIECVLVMASHKVAMLLPLTFLEGAKRAAWLETTPLARVHVFSWRISMPPGELLAAGKVKPTGGKKAFAWFVWDHGHQGPPAIRFLHKVEVGKFTPVERAA